MQVAESATAARGVIEALELADYDEEYEYYQALVADEAFCAACYLYDELGVYATHEHATEADREARDALKRSLRDHAQRVRGELEDDQEAADE